MREKSVVELTVKLNEIVAKEQENASKLCQIQTERDRLSEDLMKKQKEIDYLLQERTDLDEKVVKTTSELANVNAEFNKVVGECKSLRDKLNAREDELNRLQTEIQAQIAANGDCRMDFERQLRQSQANFERQLAEVTKQCDFVRSTNTELLNERSITEKNMRTLERQVQERDELLEKQQREVGKFLMSSDSSATMASLFSNVSHE